MKATSVLKYEKGTLYDQQRARAENEPQPRGRLLPRCPKVFDKLERKCWKYYKELATEYGLFVAANAPALERLAILRALSIPLKQWMKEHEAVKAGKRAPQFREWLRLQIEIRKDEDRIGLSTIQMAKTGASIARAKKLAGLEELLD